MYALGHRDNISNINIRIMNPDLSAVRRQSGNLTVLISRHVLLFTHLVIKQMLISQCSDVTALSGSMMSAIDGATLKGTYEVLVLVLESFAGPSLLIPARVRDGNKY